MNPMGLSILYCVTNSLRFQLYYFNLEVNVILILYCLFSWKVMSEYGMCQFKCLLICLRPTDPLLWHNIISLIEYCFNIPLHVNPTNRISQISKFEDKFRLFIFTCCKQKFWNYGMLPVSYVSSAQNSSMEFIQSKNWKLSIC